jgi:hypothetical protein
MTASRKQNILTQGSQHYQKVLSSHRTPSSNFHAALVHAVLSEKMNGAKNKSPNFVLLSFLVVVGRQSSFSLPQVGGGLYHPRLGWFCSWTYITW